MELVEDAAGDLVVLVTGSTDGIGKETARRLAAMGASVLVHGKSRERGEETVRELRGEAHGGPPGDRAPGDGATVGLVVGDLSSMEEVRGLAGQVREAGLGRLDVLINNAGIVVAGGRTETEDGHELTFAVNHLAPFLLTNLLLDELKGSAPSRVVTVSSELHGRARMEFEDLQMESDWGPRKAYNRSKLANVLFTYELARRLGGTEVTANVLHPGVVGTKLLRRGFGARGSSTPAAAAEALVHLATSPKLEGVTGHYFRQQQEAESSPGSRDEAAQRKLWELSERLCGL